LAFYISKAFFKCTKTYSNLSSFTLASGSSVINCSVALQSNSQGTSPTIFRSAKNILSPSLLSLPNCFAYIYSDYPSIGHHHPLDGITNPEYELLHFIQLTKCFSKEKKALALTGIGDALFTVDPLPLSYCI
jgi:hypothetical protein